MLTDKPGGHEDLQDGTLRWAAKQEGDQLAVDVITHWSSAHAVASTKYVHTDYAAEKPTQDMKAEATRTPSYAKHPKDLEVFDYPGGYADISMDEQPAPKIEIGKKLAQMQVDRFESGRFVAVGVTPYRFTAAGATFTFKDHDDDDGGYLITTVEYEMTFAQHEAKDSELKTGFACRFEAVPKATPYHPMPVATKPVIYGPQTATVVGTSGDEISTDKYGRAKLQFRWDRLGTSNEKSSCWVRISQPWAGKQFGMIALPRIGDEVVVEFLEGNPDRPLITGRVYNGDNMPPYKLPDQATVSGIKTQSSKGRRPDRHQRTALRRQEGRRVRLAACPEEHAHLGQERHVRLGAEQLLGRRHQELLDEDRRHRGRGHRRRHQAEDRQGRQRQARRGPDRGRHRRRGPGRQQGGRRQGRPGDRGERRPGDGPEGRPGHADRGHGQRQRQGRADRHRGRQPDHAEGRRRHDHAGAPAGVTIDGPLVKINCGGGGGSATAATEASPPAPVEPPDPTKNKDPLAQDSGGTGAGA